MTAFDLLKSVVFAAVISGVVALIVANVSARTAKKINEDKLKLDRELAEEKAKAELQLAERRFELDRQLSLAKAPLRARGRDRGRKVGGPSRNGEKVGGGWFQRHCVAECSTAYK